MTSYGRTLFRLLWIAGGSCAVCFFALAVPARTQEAPIIPNSIVVVFQGQTLPADAAAQHDNVLAAHRVHRVGGVVAVLHVDQPRLINRHTMRLAPLYVAWQLAPIMNALIRVLPAADNRQLRIGLVSGAENRSTRGGNRGRGG